MRNGISIATHAARLRKDLARREEQLASVRGAARAVLEYRDDDVAFRAAVNVLLVKVLGADAMKRDAQGETVSDGLAKWVMCDCGCDRIVRETR